MKQKNLLLMAFSFGVLSFTALTITGCDGDDDDIDLPPIAGYNNSDEVAAANLVGYWSMDGNGNESKTGTAPTTSYNVTFGPGGVKGQAATFDSGYLYYASALAPLASNQPFTVSAWVQMRNTGGSPTPPSNVPLMYFQSARPGQLWGNVNAFFEAGWFNYQSDSMRVKSSYSDAGGLQDNINDGGVSGVNHKHVKKAGTGQWAHIVTTYDPGSGTDLNILRIYGDSVLISNRDYEERGTNSFVYTTNEIIIGGWYNNIPGKTVSADPWTVPFTGKIDEVRVWKKALSPAEVQALYLLGKAGR